MRIYYIRIRICLLFYLNIIKTLPAKLKKLKKNTNLANRLGSNFNMLLYINYPLYI